MYAEAPNEEINGRYFNGPFAEFAPMTDKDGSISWVLVTAYDTPDDYFRLKGQDANNVPYHRPLLTIAAAGAVGFFAGYFALPLLAVFILSACVFPVSWASTGFYVGPRDQQ